MNNKEFLTALEKRLKGLPKEEREEAMSYYSEYLEEGSADDLGTPEDTARQILEQCAVRSLDEKKPRSSLKTFWMVILAIFAVPVGAPVAIALGAVVLAVIISLAAVIISVAASGISLIAGGLYVTFMGISIATDNFVNMLMTAGTGFSLIGIGILMTTGICCAAKHLTRLCSVLLGKLIKRGDKNEREN